jgi:hypothetical protein
MMTLLCLQSSKEMDTKWRTSDFQMLIVDKLLEVEGFLNSS